MTAGHVTIEISDDGRGMDEDTLKEIALKKGFYTSDEIESMTSNEVFDLIFLDGLSTSADINDLSGRGVGMSTVKAELDRIGGRVKVQSTPGEEPHSPSFCQGCNFKVNKGDADEQSKCKKSHGCFKRTDSDFSGRGVRRGCDREEYSMVGIHRLKLKHVTALLNVGGNINMYVGVSFDEPLIEKVFDAYCEDLEIEEDERDEYIEETAGDVINIVVGNSTADLADSGMVINLSPRWSLPRPRA